ncbi:carotenoid oxygenase family protein, partial [Streptomyces sp. BE303]|uniref:carotenoid oxygenase family protein n=1 Tax=Streptomyces sp. BE303 TaxID=3002528 RepID=UPI002E7A30E3
MSTAQPYLTGHITPDTDDDAVTGLTVDGTLPTEHTGRHLRNRHNPNPGVTPTHWFKRSGMVLVIRLREVRGEWYCYRWVRSPALVGAPYMTERGPD